MSAYWPSPWPAEDGGPLRLGVPRSGRGLAIRPDEVLHAVSRDAVIATMVVLRDPGEVYLLRHTGGVHAVSWVERIDPTTLETLGRSPDLAGGKTWPGGLAAHANGSLYVAFGRHVHRLTPALDLVASATLPRDRPYNSFVILPDGHLAMKDFGGPLPDGVTAIEHGPSELIVVEADRMETVARLGLPEPSIARLSADGNVLYVVGDTHLFRVSWTSGRLVLDETFSARYRTLDGQTYGWDAVLSAGAAWFLDNGAGSEGYAGTFRGLGVSGAPLHLVRVDLESGSVELSTICGLPNGLVANPPAVDPRRRIAVGYDSANGVLAAFDFDDDGQTIPRWSRKQNHACHPVLFPDTGELVTADYDVERAMDQIVVLDIDTGDERGRVDTGSPLQSVVFVSPGFDRDLYYCSFPCVSRITVVARDQA